jgi:hypothetical protein
MVAAACAQRVGKVYDQYLSFIALEAGLFSLGLRDTYLQLNDPAARDTQISARRPARAGRPAQALAMRSPWALQGDGV